MRACVCGGDSETNVLMLEKLGKRWRSGVFPQLTPSCDLLNEHILPLTSLSCSEYQTIIFTDTRVHPDYWIIRLASDPRPSPHLQSDAVASSSIQEASVITPCVCVLQARTTPTAQDTGSTSSLTWWRESLRLWFTLNSSASESTAILGLCSSIVPLNAASSLR